MNEYFKLYSNCIIVKGYLKSILCDLENGRYREIPNEIAELLTRNKNISLGDIYKLYLDEHDRQGVMAFLNFFTKNNWGFYTDTPDFFPELNMYWDSPSRITNAVLDIDKDSTYCLEKSIIGLNNLECKALQFRFYHGAGKAVYNLIADSIKSLDFEYIEIVSQKNNEIDDDFLTDFVEKNMRISRIIITNSQKRKTLDSKIVFLKEKINFSDNCGLISSSFFTINLEHFTESVNFNTCLNRKISIDVNGEIKNCPSMRKSYGNIKNTTLEVALNKKGFKDVWAIKKDDIKICQDCEFRRICTDCRAFTEDKGLYSKPSKCSYNPYLGTWDE